MSRKTARRKTARERYLLQFGLELSLYSTGDGWGYEWRDPNTGRHVAEGWSRGTKREGEQEAVRHIRERGYGK
ncbi:MAG: hypothetical protein MJA83_05795 [Gammaproteobacteria bacterium]|nr:hypothetical protein [Gammaproteobacteria bacterium]